MKKDDVNQYKYIYIIKTYDELKLKYKDADKKIQEMRVTIQSVKNELNKAMRVIQREVGGDVINLDTILEEN